MSTSDDSEIAASLAQIRRLERDGSALSDADPRSNSSFASSGAPPDPSSGELVSQFCHKFNKTVGVSTTSLAEVLEIIEVLVRDRN